MKRFYLAALVTGSIIAIVGLLLIFQLDSFKALTEFLDKEVPTSLFLTLMFILPIFGFPISIFLILAGVKFGFAIGLLLMACSFPIHMLVSYGIAHSFIQARLVSFLNTHGYELPQAPPGKTGWFAIVFTGLPGIPYAPKNYILALSGVPFSQIMVLGLPIHIIMGAPFTILGASTTQANILVSIIAIMAVGLCYFLFRKFRGTMTKQRH